MTRHGNQVEWALHCATALTALPAGKRLSAAALAALFEVPPKYLAKALQAMSGAGLITSTPGPRGGYALARPPSATTLANVVDAIEGGGPSFRCQEIRRRGPCRSVPATQFKGACGLAAAMYRAEAAWRRELAAITLADAVAEFTRDAAPVVLRTLGASTAHMASGPV